MPPSAPLPPFPTFVIIGAQRCATRWLKVNLNKHPDIYAPPYELDFWADRERRAAWKMSGYRRKFEGWNGEAIVGEASPSYMFYDAFPFQLSEPAKMMWKQIPDLRLIALVRDPVDRFESAVRHYVKNKMLPPDFDVVADWQNPALTHLHILKAGQYAAALEIYRHRFGDQLEIVFFDDIETDPAAVYRHVLRHIGARDDVVPGDIDRVLFGTTTSVAVAPLTVDQRNLIRSIYVPSIEDLEAMTGRDLARWKAPDT
jgi:hypothetical protein